MIDSSEKKLKCLFVLVSPPGGGKTTYRNKFLKENQNFISISRDDIRMTLRNEYVVSNEIENLITKIEKFSITQALKSGKSVIVDNCNCKESYRNEFAKLAESIGNIRYKEIFIETPLEVCLERNQLRESSKVVPEEVVRKFYKLVEPFYTGKKKPRDIEFVSKNSQIVISLQDEKLPKALICDLDGSLCLLNGRNPYDPSTCNNDLPNPPVLETIKLYSKNGYHILFVSGREERFKIQTLEFLIKNVFNIINSGNYSLLMRKTGDQRKDTIVKHEIYDNYIKDKFYVLFAIDDRPSVCREWRYEIGLPVFQINDLEF